MIFFSKMEDISKMKVSQMKHMRDLREKPFHIEQNR